MPTAAFLNNPGRFAKQAALEAATITQDGRDRLMVVSAEEYGRLTRRDRRVITPKTLMANKARGIAQAETPAEHAHLDAELADWRP